MQDRCDYANSLYCLAFFLFFLIPRVLISCSNRLEAWTVILSSTILNVEKLFSLFPVAEESIDIIVRNIWGFDQGRLVLRGNLS